ERAGPDLVPGRYERLTPIEGGAAGPAEQQESHGCRNSAGASQRPLMSPDSHASPPVRTAADRAGDSAIAWPASRARSTARTTSSHSAARGPRGDTGGGTAARRSGSGRGRTPG